MKIRVCDICGKQKDIYFRGRIKKSFPTWGNGGVQEDSIWFRADICEDCLKRIKTEVSE